MQGGPAIPWDIAEIIYARYAELFPASARSQSLERIHERGGFGWAEVELMFSHPPQRDIDRVKAAISAAEERTAAPESEVERLKALHAEDGMNILAGEIADLRDEVRMLKAKAALLEDMAGTFFKGLSVHSPASLSRRYNALTAGVARSPS